MTTAARLSLLFEYLDRVPGSVRRCLLVLECAFEIHFRQYVVRIEFEKPREKDFCFFEIAVAEFADRIFVNIEPLQKFRIDIIFPRTDERENIDRLGFSFHLSTRDQSKMEVITHKFGCALADEDIDTVNARERFQSRSEVDGVTDDGWIEPFVRFVGTDIADDRLAVIDSNAERERVCSLSLPGRIELRHFTSHPECRTYSRFRIFRRAVAAHVSPNGHDRVADKFIERAAIIEDHRHHATEVTI